MECGVALIPYTLMSGNYPNSTMPFDHDSQDLHGFEVSDFFELGDWIEEDENPPFPDSVHDGTGSFYPPFYTSSNEMVVANSSGIGASSSFHDTTTTTNRDGKETKIENKEKVAFKTKSEVEVLDDGFKWRKYGKKMVKNSPNPRNYYRCSVEGCPVKKRVERDKEDPRYVVTTYEGIHNHMGPHL